MIGNLRMEDLKAIANSLIALCQREGLLSVETDVLAGELADLASNERIISEGDIADWLYE